MPCLYSAHTTVEEPRSSPEDFPERLKRFQGESGLSWSEVARLIGTYRHTVWRCAEGTVRPNLSAHAGAWPWTGSLDLLKAGIVAVQKWVTPGARLSSRPGSRSSLLSSWMR